MWWDILNDLCRSHFSKQGSLTDETTDFWPILVDLQELVCQFRELNPVVCDVQDIRINIDIVDPMRIKRKDPLELLLGFTKVYGARVNPSKQNQFTDFTVLVIQCTGPHAHHPRAYGEEIIRQEPLAEL
jgi:hypothetical protein